MVSLLARFMSRLPYGALPWMARAGAICLPGRKRGHKEACRRLLGSGSIEPWHNRKAVESHALLVLEFLARLGGRQFSVVPPTDALTSDRRGRLLVTTHRGNWLLGAAALTDQVGPVHTVAGVQFRPTWSDFVEGWLADRNVIVHTAGSLPVLKRAIRNGESVLLHLDGDPFPPGVRGMRLRAVPSGVRSAAVLAAGGEVDVYFTHCLRRGDHFEICSRRISEPEASRSATWTARVQNWEREFFSALKASVAEAPEDWLVFRSSHLGNG